MIIFFALSLAVKPVIGFDRCKILKPQDFPAHCPRDSLGQTAQPVRGAVIGMADQPEAAGQGDLAGQDTGDAGRKGDRKVMHDAQPPPARMACICTETEFDVTCAISAPVSAR